jgi:hypothetical protein
MITNIMKYQEVVGTVSLLGQQALFLTWVLCCHFMDVLMILIMEASEKRYIRSTHCYPDYITEHNEYYISDRDIAKDFENNFITINYTDSSESSSDENPCLKFSSFTS